MMTTKWRIFHQPLYENVGKLSMGITRLHSLCIDEGSALAPNADEIEGNGPRFVPSDICETSILVNSVLHDIKVQELSQQSLERPSFNSFTQSKSTVRILYNRGCQS